MMSVERRNINLTLGRDESLSDILPSMSSFPGFFVNMIKGFRAFGFLSLTSCTSEAVIPPNLVLRSSCKLWVFLSNLDYYPRAAIVDSYLDDWAKIVQDVIRDKLYKETILSRFPYQEDKVNEWFLEKIPEGQAGLPGRTFNILNFTQRPKAGSYPNLDGAVYPPSVEEEGYKILCHGTGQDAIMDILESGIDLGKLDAGRKQDFSRGRGFYLTTFEEAVDWAFHRRGHNGNAGQAAVILFKIPNGPGDVINEKSIRDRSLNLVGEENKERWKEVVTNIQREKRGKSYIEGPWIDRRGNGVKQQEGTYQMCIFSEELVREFNQNLHSIVFYNTEKHKEKRDSGSRPLKTQKRERKNAF